MGTKTMEDFLDVAPRYSLKTMGLLEKPSAPLLAVNGKNNNQAPIDDVYLLMEHGNPKWLASTGKATTWGEHQAWRHRRSPDNDCRLAERASDAPIMSRGTHSLSEPAMTL